MERLRQGRVLRFGTYEVDVRSGELRKAGVRIKVQQQPLKLLEILLEHPGELVTREELRTSIWPNESFGDFDQAVNVAIAKLRSALSDSAANPRYIETIPRRGYRFLAEVRAEDSERLPAAPASPTLAGRSDAASSRPENRARRRTHGVGFWLMVALSLLLLGVAIFAGQRWRRRSSASASPTVTIRSLAVLPLENLSGDEQDYFADGMTDELITDLAQIAALRVISRTSAMAYKGARRPLSQVARELKVDAVVEGTVLRSGNQVRITAQLIQASADKHLWAQSYEGDVRDTLALQKQVAEAIADQIRIQLTPREQAALRSSAPVDAQAYEDYLKGRFFFNKRNSNEKAQSYFQQAIRKAASYPPPYAGLADTYLLSDEPRLARESVQKALELDNDLAEAHNSLAELLYEFDRDWIGAEKEFKRALELGPNYAPAHHWYSMFLSTMGRKPEALAEAQKAYAVDPLSPVVGANLAKILEENGHYDQAIEQAKRTLELDPNSAVTHGVLGVIYEDKKRYPDAIAEYKTALQLHGAPGEMRGLLGYVYAVSGDRADALEMIRELMRLWPGHAHAALDMAVVYSGLDDKDQALSWLEKASQREVGDLAELGRNPHFFQMRGDQRFEDLVRRSAGPH